MYVENVVENPIFVLIYTIYSIRLSGYAECSISLKTIVRLIGTNKRWYDIIINDGVVEYFTL